MSDPTRVLIVDSFDSAGISLLRQVAKVDIHPHLNSGDLAQQIGPYHALIVGSDTHVDERLIEAAYNLRVIACTGSRLDQIDVSAARPLQIALRSRYPQSHRLPLPESPLERFTVVAGEPLSPAALPDDLFDGLAHQPLRPPPSFLRD